jgi:hypothetical protein
LTNCPGYVVVVVETALSYTDAVNPYINFVTYAHLTDVQLSVPPTTGITLPIAPSELARNRIDFKRENDKPAITLQMDTGSDLNLRTAQPSITQTQVVEQDPALASSSTAKTTSTVAASGSTGEMTNSLAQLTRCFTQSGTRGPSTTTSGNGAMVFTPAIYTEEVVDDIPFNGIDLLDSIGAAYAFQKGGYVIRLVPLNRTTGNVPIINPTTLIRSYVIDTTTIASEPFYSIRKLDVINTIGETVFPRNVSSRFVLSKPDLEGGITIHMPYNQPTGRILNTPPENSDFKTPKRYSVVIPYSEMNIQPNIQTIKGLSEGATITYSQQSNAIAFYRRGADDFKYGVLIALPEMASVYDL